MTLTLTTFLIVCPLTFLAGFVDAIAGGGGLISLPAFMIAGVPAHMSIATNKLSSSMGTTAATIRYAASGFINWKLALPAACIALIASSLGAQLALALDETVFTVIMLVVLPLTALYLLYPRKTVKEKEPLPYRKSMLIAMGIAFVIGVYDGFYGPGTGTFMILLLTGLAHLGLQQANGVTKVMNLTTNVSALVVFLLSGNVLLPLGMAAGAFNIAGNLLGAQMFTQKGSSIVKPIMVVVIAVFFVKTALGLAGVI